MISRISIEKGAPGKSRPGPPLVPGDVVAAGPFFFNGRHLGSALPGSG